MKILKIRRNLWAGYPTWFIKTGESGRYATGISVCDTRALDGEIKIKFNSKYYLQDIRHDKEHFPVVGGLDIEQILMQAISHCMEVSEDG